MISYSPESFCADSMESGRPFLGDLRQVRIKDLLLSFYDNLRRPLTDDVLKIIRRPCRHVNTANCLIKNLFEIDTLPHLKIYSKLSERKQGNRSVLQEEMEGRNELNDGRKACLDQKLCPPLPEEAQEG